MMRISVITNETLKAELLAQGVAENTAITWLEEPEPVTGTDCYIDLLFKDDPARINTLKELQPSLIIINELMGPTETLPANFIRINGWNSFLKRPLVEATGGETNFKRIAEEVFASFNKTIEWTVDQPGFITARVIAAIINEAYFALGENVSSREEIDTAMKLGTNYPQGPFEWSEMIGLKKVYELLVSLARKNSRYDPAPLLIKEALS